MTKRVEQNISGSLTRSFCERRTHLHCRVEVDESLDSKIRIKAIEYEVEPEVIWWFGNYRILSDGRTEYYDNHGWKPHSANLPESCALAEAYAALWREKRS